MSGQESFTDRMRYFVEQVQEVGRLDLIDELVHPDFRNHTAEPGQRDDREGVRETMAAHTSRHRQRRPGCRTLPTRLRHRAEQPAPGTRRRTGVTAPSALRDGVAARGLTPRRTWSVLGPAGRRSDARTTRSPRARTWQVVTGCGYG